MTTTPHVDVLIVGAGISGIAAACHLQMESPTRTYAILEGRGDIGGTWDLFRYPGVRSDSDMHTLGFNFKPWTAEKSIADGPSSWPTSARPSPSTASTPHIRFDHLVHRAEWSTDDARWTVTRRARTGETVTLTCNFLFMCSGYYSYQRGLHARLRRHRRLHRHGRAPAAVARRPRLRGQARRGHRLGRDGDDARAGHGRRGGTRHDAAAHAHVRRVGPRPRRRREHAAQGAARQARLLDHAQEERRDAAVPLPAHAHPAGEGEEVPARQGAQGAGPTSTSTRTSPRRTTRGTSACAWCRTATCSSRSATARPRSSPTTSRRSRRPASA